MERFYAVGLKAYDMMHIRYTCESRIIGNCELDIDHDGFQEQMLTTAR
jgi:hypothetical protein